MGRAAARERHADQARLMSWDLSCPDWEDRLRAGRSLVPDLPLDLVTGNRAVAAFNKLRLHDVPLTPTMGEAGGDWFRDIVRALFGSQDPVTRQRMIRELFLLIPKKNSKTTNGALLMLTALLLNERPNASMVMTGPVQETAQLAFDAAAGAIALDPVLDKLLHVRDHLKTIVHRQTGAKLVIMTFDPAAVTGQKPTAVLIDELHVVATMHKAPRAIRQLRGGMLPFPEAFMAFITTQSEEAPSGVFKAELIKAREIRDGKRRGVMLPVLYEFSEAMQKAKDQPWKDPANWHMIAPNAGRSITIERLIEEMETAEQTSPEELQGWASQFLNIEIGTALAASGWRGAQHWDACVDETLDSLEALLARCEVVDMGIDGGGLDDLLGLSVVGREIETGRWLAWFHAWMHPSVLEYRKSEEQRLMGFVDDGDLTLVEEAGQDIEELAEIAETVEDSGLLDKIGVDPAGLGGILDALEGAGVPKEKIIGISQGWKMSGSIKTAERRLFAGTLIHGGQPLMAWCVGNAKVIPVGNAINITKQASGTGKIDPLMAGFNAVSLISLNPAPANQWDDFLKAPAKAGAR
jgi:phage terminase large subunit-like protein